jgi:hypothetical protein
MEYAECPLNEMRWKVLQEFGRSRVASLRLRHERFKNMLLASWRDVGTVPYAVGPIRSAGGNAVCHRTDFFRVTRQSGFKR